MQLAKVDTIITRGLPIGSKCEQGAGQDKYKNLNGQFFFFAVIQL